MRRTRRVCGQTASGALLLPAAFAVHQLRYMLAFGAGAGPELERTGHSYLHSVVPWLILLLALAAGGFLRALGRAFSRQTTARRYSLSFVALWVACTGALVAIFAAQELLEGLFATDTPPAWRGSSATAGGGRCPRRRASDWCWPPAFTGLAGSWRRSPAGPRRIGPHGRPRPAPRQPRSRSDSPRIRCCRGGARGARRLAASGSYLASRRAVGSADLSSSHSRGSPSDTSDRG